MFGIEQREQDTFQKRTILVDILNTHSVAANPKRGVTLCASRCRLLPC